MLNAATGVIEEPNPTFDGLAVFNSISVPILWTCVPQKARTDGVSLGGEQGPHEQSDSWKMGCDD